MVLENKNIVSEIAFRPILGLGTTAITFLTKDKKVLKLFLDTERKDRLFKEYDMFSHLQELGNIKVKNIYTPNDIYVNNGKAVATKLDYIKGDVLERHIPNITLKVFTEMLLELIEETHELSKLGVYVRDFHSRNVIINRNGINIFDTDQFDLTYFNEDVCLEHNLNEFIHEILMSVFKIPYGFTFDSKYLNQVLSKFYSAIGTYEDDLTLYYALCKEFGEDESIKNVNRLIKEIGRY